MRRHKPYLFLFLLLAPIAKGAGAPKEIPFRLVCDFAIIARGSIGAANDLNFLLDTGAVPSVISARLASRMEVRGESGPFRLLNEDLQAQSVTVSDVCLGTICSSRFPMVVVDLTRFENLLRVRIDAVIGLDLLAGEDIRIDYRARKIVLGLSGRTEHEVSAEISSAAGAPYWLVPIEFGGQRFRMLLDTGANQLGLLTGVGRKMVMSGSGTVKSAWRSGEPQHFTMGDAFFRQTSFILEEPAGAMQGIDGILGPRALGISRIELDWKHHTLRWGEK